MTGTPNTLDRTRKPLTSEEVMEILGISRWLFWKYMNEYPEHFRTYKSGRWRVMDPEDLEHWRQFQKSMDRA